MLNKSHVHTILQWWYFPFSSAVMGQAYWLPVDWLYVVAIDSPFHSLTYFESPAPTSCVVGHYSLSLQYNWRPRGWVQWVRCTRNQTHVYEGSRWAGLSRDAQFVHKTLTQPTLGSFPYHILNPSPRVSCRNPFLLSLVQPCLISLICFLTQICLLLPVPALHPQTHHFLHSSPP